MKFITQISRIIVGALFIFSGLIKLNDPVGFSFKLDEYFGADVLNLTFLQPFALELAVFVVILEVLLGVALLIGFWKNITSWLLLLMIVFFTFLTFYSAYFNKVTDCGCFGDAIPLTPWESFGKDVILTILILIVFFNRQYIKPIAGRSFQIATMGFAVIGCMGLGIYVLNHLPVIDFRAYAEGKSISEGMKSAEELGLEPPKYMTIYYLQDTTSGEEVKVNSDEYVADKWWEKKQYKMLSDKTETKKVSDGYEPPVHDFVIYQEDMDRTDEILNMDAVFLVIAYRMNNTEPEGYPVINALATEAEKAGIPVIGLSASLIDEVEVKRHEFQTPFPFATVDETTLKTIIRSNPGVVLLKKGTVVKKWHFNDVPTFDEAKKAHL